MRRQLQEIAHDLADLHAKLGGCPADSPFAGIYRGLHDLLKSAEHQSLNASGYGPSITAMRGFIERMLQRMPVNPGDRLLFDAATVRRLAEQLSSEKIRIDGTIIYPCYVNAEWGYEDVSIGGSSTTRMLAFIHFPKPDELHGVDLLEYPFLIHEFGHEMLRYHSGAFHQDFDAALHRHIGELRLRGISDKGLAKTQALQLETAIGSYWRPQESHQDWAHELAIDIISFWICGPAYAACLQDAIELENADVHRIAQGHPPYIVRLQGILLVAADLQWEMQSGVLANISAKYFSNSGQNLGQYPALTDARLVRLVVDAAVATCNAIGLPQMTAKRLDAIRNAVQNGDKIDNGIDSIVAASIIFEQCGEKEYDEWQRKYIANEISEIRLANS